MRKLLRITLTNKDGASWLRRVARSAGLLAACLGAIALFLHVCWVAPLGDFSPARTPVMPHTGAAALLPETQTEPHTCGLHAIRSVYRSFGLDPDTYRLRARLGVDNPGTVLDNQSTGTLQPDLYRVLDQDGFSFESDFAETPDHAALKAHLQNGLPAMALIQRPETEGLHWVVLSRSDPTTGQYTVVDSLLPTSPQATDAGPAWNLRMLGTVRISPRPTGNGGRSPWGLHTQGLRDMMRTAKRSSELLPSGRGLVHHLNERQLGRHLPTQKSDS